VNAGHTSERVYDALRTRIVEHDFRPGDRLDPASLAEGLASSVTPVRDALHRLVGENLVETALSEGFRIPHVNLPQIQDLLGWNRQILRLALQDWDAAKHAAYTAQPPATPAVGIGLAFKEIARRSRNQEHQRAIRSANARLHAVRLVEDDLFPDREAELDQIETALQEPGAAGLRALIDRYHRRRRRVAPELVRLLYRHA